MTSEATPRPENRRPSSEERGALALGRARLSPRIVAALDAARAGAASYVVMHHLSSPALRATSIGIFFRFGQEAVIVFFLLSGFVIFANERDRGLNTTAYYMRRVRRIYPPLLFAMAISAIVGLLIGNFWAEFSYQSLIGTLFALQDNTDGQPGVITGPFMGNSPLWSLSYEVFFYLIFPFVLRCWRAWPAATNHLVGAISCLAYIAFAFSPHHLFIVTAYFLIWWCGCMTAQRYLDGVRCIRGMKALTAWLLLLCVVSLLVVYETGFRGLGVYPFLSARHFLASASLLFLFFGPIGAALASLALRFRRASAFLASISYGLYVLHWPILIQSGLAGSPVGAASGLVILFIAARLGDSLILRPRSQQLPR